MEKKILKNTTIIMCFASVILVSVLFYLPEKIAALENHYQASVKEARDRERLFDLLQNMSGIDYLQMVTKQTLIAANNKEEDVDAYIPPEQADFMETDFEELPFDSQLRIELPEGVDFSQIDFTNDYMNRDITFRIPGAGEAYLIEYPMLGSTEHISDLNFEYTDQGMSAVFHMDGIFEPVLDYDERYIYLDFVDPHEIYDKIIVIDAGHGGGQPGACEPEIEEKMLNLSMVLKIKEKFDADKEHNYGVYYTRLTDKTVQNADRIAFANEIKANMFVSVHCNALNDSHTALGCGVMYNQNEEERELSSKNLSLTLLDSLLKNMKSESKGLINGGTILVLHHAQVPAALIEVGFMTTPSELKNLMSEKYQYKMAQGVYEGILAAFEKGY